jgi:hypothetical protein
VSLPWPLLPLLLWRSLLVLLLLTCKHKWRSAHEFCPLLQGVLFIVTIVALFARHLKSTTITVYKIDTKLSLRPTESNPSAAEVTWNYPENYYRMAILNDTCPNTKHIDDSQ